jgi:AcrR family transcriptional regulator
VAVRTKARRPRDEARRARTDVYRQHILEAAERVFAERGFEAAKLQEIGRVAGLSMGTIYAIFPGKQELYGAILAARGEELHRLAREASARDLPPRAALDALIELYIGWFLAHPDFLRMHLRSGASWALGPVAPTQGQIAHWEDIHRLQAEIFRRGIAAGEFVEEDPSYLARLFSVMDQVLLAEWVAGGMKPERERLVSRLRAQVTRAFAR